MKTRILTSSAIVLLSSVFVTYQPWVAAQQLPDKDFDPPIANPAYPQGQGPRVVIDEAHYNFHRKDESFYAFTNVLTKDGYVVEALKDQLSADTLKDVEVLVIANPANEVNGTTPETWNMPFPSAFTTEEIDAVVNWVNDGGAFFLLADHMPWGGAVEALVSRFGFITNSGYALPVYFFEDPKNPQADYTIRFWHEGNIVSRGDGYLHSHPILEGRDASEKIEFVVSFGGQAFSAKPGTSIHPLMVLGEGSRQIFPTNADRSKWLTETGEWLLPSAGSEGMLQGATLKYGKGRMVLLGESGMATAQIAGGSFTMGMNDPAAPHNVQFILNAMHWLTGLLPEYTQKVCESGKSEPTIISSDLTTEIPCAIYKTPFGEMNLNIILQYVPDENGSLLFRVDQVQRLDK